MIRVLKNRQVDDNAPSWFYCFALEFHSGHDMVLDVLPMRGHRVLPVSPRSRCLLFPNTRSYVRRCGLLEQLRPRFITDITVWDKVVCGLKLSHGIKRLIPEEAVIFELNKSKLIFRQLLQLVNLWPARAFLEQRELRGIGLRLDLLGSST